jgi:hypothetical protein
MHNLTNCETYVVYTNVLEYSKQGNEYAAITYQLKYFKYDKGLLIYTVCDDFILTVALRLDQYLRSP